MKPLIVILGLLIVCLLLVFVARHHRRVENTDRPCTLGEIYAELLSKAWSTLKEIVTASDSLRGAIWMVGLTVTGLLAASFPVLFVPLTQWWPVPSRSAICVMAGTLVLIGAGANFLAMLVSHMMIGFGSSTSQGETAFIWIIPVFQALFGLASIVAGSSARFAACLNHCLN